MFWWGPWQVPGRPIGKTDSDVWCQAETALKLSKQGSGLTSLLSLPLLLLAIKTIVCTVHCCLGYATVNEWLFLPITNVCYSSTFTADCPCDAFIVFYGPFYRVFFFNHYTLANFHYNYVNGAYFMN